MGVGDVGEPPPEEGGRLIDRPAEKSKPGLAELRLEGEPPGGPFRRSPDEAEDGSADDKNLDPEDLRGVHCDPRSAGSLSGRPNPELRGAETRDAAAEQ